MEEKNQKQLQAKAYLCTTLLSSQTKNCDIESFFF